MMDEFRHHIALRTEHLVREGLSPAEAARRARLEFGPVERHREEARASRGLRWFDEMRFSWLDVKLGLRMLAKHPGLSIVSVLGMAVAIAVGAGASSFISAMMDPSLPLPAGDRIVSIQTLSRNIGNPHRRSLHDFLLWREELTSIRDVAAYRTESRNLMGEDGAVDLVRVARMTASGFRVAGVPPILGRPLLDEDERPGVPPVVVMGHEEWQRRFDGRPDVVGRTVRLGEEPHTVVGVMPEGFRFPVNHGYWAPLRLDPAEHPVGAGPVLFMFGRLAPDATMGEARAELGTLGRRMAAEHPESHAQLRPEVLPYTHPYFDIDSPGFAMALHGLRLAIGLLLVLVAANVAVLIYARTATRIGEITVRTALGASRKRIVTQLFAEALVLSGLAAALGLLIAGVGLAEVQAFLVRVTSDDFPFWFDMRLTLSVAAYVAGLGILAGVIVGVLPALKATGSRVQAGLQRLSTRASGAQLGPTWTALIVTQVALAVFILPFALYISVNGMMRGTGAPAYPADEVLVAWVALHGDEARPAAMAARYDSLHHAAYLETTRTLLARLESEPAVAGAAFVRSALHAPRYGTVEVDGGVTDGVRVSDVDPALLDVLGLPVLAGRGLVPADTLEGAGVAVVDRAFAERFLGGGDVVGRRIRELRWVGGAGGAPGTYEPGEWLEVVGVVQAHGSSFEFESVPPHLYRPARLASLESVGLAVRVRGTPPLAFTPRLRQVAASVDPRLLLHEIRTSAEIEREGRRGLIYQALAVAVITTTVLLLSGAGIYAMMSFTVARRRREIGIRSALGAAPRRVIRGIFARSASQLGVGVAGGLFLAIAAERAAGGLFERTGLVLFLAVAALVLLLGLVASLGPARRILAVQPTEVLREE